MSIMFWPVRGTVVETLALSTKAEISRRVAETVYRELRNNNFLESAYMREVAAKIADSLFEIEIVPHENSDSFSIKSKMKETK